MRGGARGDKYPEDFSGLLMELADMSALEADAVKSVGVRIPRGPPILQRSRRETGYPNGVLTRTKVGSNPTETSNFQRAASQTYTTVRYERTGRG